MSTIQHHSSKVNNFVGGEVNLSNLNVLATKQASAETQKQFQSLEPAAARSLSPTMKSKGRNSSYLNQMRHSQENRPTGSHYYASQQSTSLDHMRQQHNYSATIEGSRMDDCADEATHFDRERLVQRKRSMPPAQVHIPLLDFSKLNKPQQPT